jgi:voltage-dependent calcium channel N type alpha-1B
MTHRNNRRNHHLNYKGYGTTSLMQRSRSPSPARIAQEMRERERYYRNEMGTDMIPKKRDKN